MVSSLCTFTYPPFLHTLTPSFLTPLSSHPHTLTPSHPHTLTKGAAADAHSLGQDGRQSFRRLCGGGTGEVTWVSGRRVCCAHTLFTLSSHPPSFFLLPSLFLTLPFPFFPFFLLSPSSSPFSPSSFPSSFPSSSSSSSSPSFLQRVQHFSRHSATQVG